MIAGEEVAQAMIVERPAVADNAQTLEGRPVTGLPVIEEVGDNGVELFFRRVPGLIEVVVDAGGVDGANGRFGVRVGGEEDAARFGVERARPLKHFHAAHAGHALVADEQGHGLVAGFQLREHVEGSLAASGAHDAVGFTILAAQILDHGLKHAHIVVYRQ